MDMLEMLRQRSEAAMNRFKLVTGTLTPARFVALQKPQPSPEQIRADVLRPWVGQDVCEEAFLPWLDDQIRKAEAAVEANRLVHPGLTYALGCRDAYRHLRKSFLFWRGQANRPMPLEEK